MVSTKDNVGTNNTVQKKERPQSRHLKPFQPGQIANPKGRPLGSRNKFAEAFVKDFLADWQKAGPSAIQNCRLEDPAAYLRIAASLVPKEFNIKDNEGVLANIIDQFDDEQLDQFLGLLNAIAAGSLVTDGKGQKAKALTRGQPDGVH